MSRPACLAATLVLAVLLTGCAWTAQRPLPSPEDGRPRLSHAALVRRAEVACARRSRALAALPRPRTKAQARRFFARVAALERAELEALAALRPPRRDEREYARLLEASLELAEISQRFQAAVVRDKPHERRRALAAAERASAAYDRAARRLDLACRQSG
jgi:hypothetical protein